MDEGELRRLARLVNLLGDWPGAAGKGDAFPMREAKARASRMRLRGTVLFCGRGVASAFGVDEPYFEWFPLRGSRVAIIPHPSGISHWWSDPANVARAGAFLSGLLGGSPCGNEHCRYSVYEWHDAACPRTRRLPDPTGHRAFVDAIVGSG